jgi:hypothetical protein
MSEITTIGLDLAKSVFQVHGIDEQGRVVVRKRLRRSQVLGFFAGLSRCLVGMEACATAHYWARELMGLGHEVRPVGCGGEYRDFVRSWPAIPIRPVVYGSSNASGSIWRLSRNSIPTRARNRPF